LHPINELSEKQQGCCVEPGRHIPAVDREFGKIKREFTASLRDFVKPI
jgi:hypothetical protein